MNLAALAGLFTASFLAATIFPAQSEFALAGLLAAGQGDPWVLVAVASVGNTLGSVVNWALGRGLERLRRLPWLHVPERAYARAERWYNRFGVWSLLLAWTPVLGDPLTVVAGALHVPLPLFVALVGLGKTLRYIAVVALAGAFTG